MFPVHPSVYNNSGGRAGVGDFNPGVSQRPTHNIPMAGHGLRGFPGQGGRYRPQGGAPQVFGGNRRGGAGWFPNRGSRSGGGMPGVQAGEWDWNKGGQQQRMADRQRRLGGQRQGPTTLPGEIPGQDISGQRRPTGGRGGAGWFPSRGRRGSAPQGRGSMHGAIAAPQSRGAQSRGGGMSRNEFMRRYGKMDGSRYGGGRQGGQGGGRQGGRRPLFGSRQNATWDPRRRIGSVGPAGRHVRGRSGGGVRGRGAPAAWGRSSTGKQMWAPGGRARPGTTMSGAGGRSGGGQRGGMQQRQRDRYRRGGSLGPSVKGYAGGNRYRSSSSRRPTESQKGKDAARGKRRGGYTATYSSRKPSSRKTSGRKGRRRTWKEQQAYRQRKSRQQAEARKRRANPAAARAKERSQFRVAKGGPQARPDINITPPSRRPSHWSGDGQFKNSVPYKGRKNRSIGDMPSGGRVTDRMKKKYPGAIF